MANYSTIFVNGKRAFITQICNDLQTVKKEYLSDKRYSKKARQYKRVFYVTYKDLRKFEWFINIYVTDVFTIQLCMVQETTKPNASIFHYFDKDLMTSKNDTTYNVCRNITEFREFLKREVYEEGMEW